MKHKGYLLLLLHAHLPFVRHPEHEVFVQERWLFQAIVECYLPLLDALERLSADGVPCRVTLSLSPTLMAMLDDALLRRRFLDHLQGMIALAGAETRQAGQRGQLAHYYLKVWSRARDKYLDVYDQDLLSAFQGFERQGLLELITTAATHGYLPLLREHPGAVRGQLCVARDMFQQRFGHPPVGVWLPECGYYPGLEEQLAEAGFGYFFVDSHALRNGRPRPVHGVQQPVACGSLAAFGRDPDCTAQVWSREQGYPGHPDYREYHRDMGYELSPEQLGSLALADAEQAPVGLKYHRITDRHSDEKLSYDPAAAQARARLDARDFVQRRLRALGAGRLLDRPRLFLAPYDAELFGHWWYEGPTFFEQLIRETASVDELQMLSAADYLSRHPLLPRVQPSAASWGEGGYNAYWLNRDNAWLYPHLMQASTELQAGIRRCLADGCDALQRRALNQAGRSLLLAQASDWPFIMHSGQSTEYAVKRVTDLLSRYRFLMDALQSRKIDEYRLCALEQLDNLFPDLDALSLKG